MFNIPLRHWISHYRFLFLFILMLSFFIIKAVSPHEYFSIITSFTFFILVVYSIYVIGRQRLSLCLWVFIVGALVFGLALFNNFYNAIAINLLIEVLSILFYVLMLYACLYYSLLENIISATSLFGSLCAYLFLGLIFSSVYQFIYYLNSAAFSGISRNSEQALDDFVYFSFVTLTTLGYGDIEPISNIAKTIAWIEAYLGQAYLTILMALMVGRYLNQRNKEKL